MHPLIILFSAIVLYFSTISVVIVDALNDVLTIKYIKNGAHIKK